MQTDAKRLKELKKLVLEGLYVNETGEEEVFEHFYSIHNDDKADLLALIDAEIARQSVKSEDVQEAIETLKYIYPSQKEIGSGEYPQVAEAIDLAITALQAYQPWVSDEGRFPDEAEKEYNKNFEAKCNKTGINLLAEPSDADEWRAVKPAKHNEPYWFLYRSDRLVCHALKEDIETILIALRQYQKPTDEEVHPDDLDAATIDAIDWLEFMKRCHNELWNSADEEDRLEPGAYEQHKSTLKAFDLAIQGLRQMRMEPWIPVSERLPTEDDADEKGNVLCYWTDEAIETYQARWIEEWNSDRNHKDKITHWRPLPAPPEGSE